jgi:hypothetical protein
MMSIYNHFFGLIVIVNIMIFSSGLSVTLVSDQQHKGQEVTIEQLNQLQENIKPHVLESIRNIENKLSVSLSPEEKIQVAAAVELEMAKLQSVLVTMNDSMFTTKVVLFSMIFAIIIVVLSACIIKYGMPMFIDYFWQQSGIDRKRLSHYLECLEEIRKEYHKNL